MSNWTAAPGDEEIDLGSLRVGFDNQVRDIIARENAARVSRDAQEQSTRVALRRRVDKTSNRVRYGTK